MSAAGRPAGRAVLFHPLGGAGQGLVQAARAAAAGAISAAAAGATLLFSADAGGCLRAGRLDVRKRDRHQHPQFARRSDKLGAGVQHRRLAVRVHHPQVEALHVAAHAQDGHDVFAPVPRGEHGRPCIGRHVLKPAARLDGIAGFHDEVLFRIDLPGRDVLGDALPAPCADSWLA